MSDELLHDLARRAGIAVEWQDHAGRPRVVGADVLRRILAALGLPADSSRELSASRRALSRRTGMADLPPLVTGIAGRPTRLDIGGNEAQPARVILENGDTRDVSLLPARGRLRVPALAEAGYHRMRIDDREIVLAIAPARCRSIDDVVPDARLWGTAAQAYTLRTEDDHGIGDTAGAAALAESVSQLGADALSLSPLHALFAADPARGQPHAPSSRLFRNPLYAAPGLVFGDAFVAAAMAEAGLDDRPDPPDRMPPHQASPHQASPHEALPHEAPPHPAPPHQAAIDWRAAATAKLAMLQAIFDSFLDAPEWDGPLGADFARFRAEGGRLLHDHACFEALYHEQMPISDWRQWPVDLRDPASAAVAAFADAHPLDLLFHEFLQWLTDRSLRAAQMRARSGGMRIGLLTDIAVGMDPTGSHAWSRQGDVLLGVSIGAPPDRHHPQGQRWGVTGLSPRALELGGFAGFIATLRASMRRVGGVRLCHAGSMARLWLVPDGADPAEGAWLSYPTVDLLRLTALESTRHNAVVIADDLDGAPPGFGDVLEQTGVHEIRLLRTERSTQGGFAAPRDWSRSAVAMTSPSAGPTVAAWWHGTDLAPTPATNGDGTPDSNGEAERDADRNALWTALVTETVADGPPPPPDKPEAVVDAALRFVARTEAPLCLVPVEDFLAQEVPPAGSAPAQNGHHWLPMPADAVFRDETAKRRALSVAQERPRQ
jgi:4-alpha-glucanotransferase